MKPMKLFVWTDLSSYQVCVYAQDVAKARELALLQLDDNDGSCPIRAEAAEKVRANNPDIWQHNPVAFVCIAEDAENANSEVHFL